jgi:hypothetical protein
MSATVEPEFLIRVFLKLRQRDVNLGVSDLLAALRLIEGDWPFKDLTELRQDTQRLWCYAWEHKRILEEIWREEEQSLPSPAPTPAEKTAPTLPEESRLRPKEMTTPSGAEGREPSVAKPDDAMVSSLPVRAPMRSGGRAEISIRWPLTTRAMTYSWQSLRRLRPDGPR